MSTLTRTRRLWTALATAVIVSAAHLAEAQTFTISVPDRKPNPADAATNFNLPVGAVRITLDMSGNPAGSSLSIGGAPAISFNIGNQIVTTAFGTDLVKFRQIPATNKIEIVMLLNSNMDVADNYCVKKATGLSFPQARSMTLTPPAGVTVVGHRLSSSSALSTFQCNCPVRRIENNRVTWTTPPPGTDQGRNPLDVVLVLDRSGSMANDAPGGTEDKMVILKWAVSQFIDQWKAELNPPGEDRLAVVWFESGVTVGSNFVTRATAGGWDTIKSNVNLQTTAGATAMGDGLTKAIDMWQDDPLNDSTIVLMTNGMQNTGNQIKPGSQTPNPALAAQPDMACFISNANGGAGEYQLLRDQCIPVQTIGVGYPANYPGDVLNKVANQTGGKANQNLGNTMDLTFGQTLVNILKGNTPSTLGQFEDAFAVQATTGIPRTAELDGSVRQAVFVLSWRANLESNQRPRLLIQAPGGATVPPVLSFDDPFYTVQTVNLPASGASGTWTITPFRAGGLGRALPYHLSFYVESRLEFRPHFASADNRAGDPLIPQVQLTFDGQPLLNVGSALTARVFAPPGALGTKLHDQTVPGPVLTTDPPGLTSEVPGAPGAPYNRKLFHLVQTTGLLDEITPREVPPPVKFHDDGLAGDAKANDGLYSFRISDADLPGQYIFELDLDFDSPATGKLKRHEKLMTIVGLKADPNSTPITVSGDPSGTTRTIEVEPKDALGNFLGPGFADYIKVTVVGGTVAPITDPQEIGRYVVSVTGLPPGSDPDVSVVVDGQTVYTGPASGIGKERRFAVFAGLGANMPQGTFGNTYDGGFSLQAGAELMLAKYFSLEGVFGYDRFSDAPDLNVASLSARAKVYVPIANPRMAAFMGVGAYFFDPGDTYKGVSAGGVVEFKVAPQWSVEVTYTLHNVDTPTNTSRYSAVHGGFRFRF